MRQTLIAFLAFVGCCLGVVPDLLGAAPRCMCLHPQIQPTSAAGTAVGGRTCSASVSAARETQLDVVDVLLAFDASAANWVKFNGKGSVDDYAAACIKKMNACLEKSDLLSAFHFRLAGTVTIDLDLSGGDLGDVLGQFIDDYGRDVARGAYAVVPAARETYGADVVSILVANGLTGTVGLGYSLMDSSTGDTFSTSPASIVDFAPWAYSACSIQSVDADYTLTHEVGHNMGAGHPDESCASADAFSAWQWTSFGRGWQLVKGGNLGPQLYDYSAGYYFWIGETGYYTIMAYNFGGRDPEGLVNDDLLFEPVPYFSSPDLLYQHTPVGTSLNDNRRTLLATYKYVAQFRASKTNDEGDDVDDTESTAVTVAGYTVEGAFQPTKALNAKAPYVGVAYSNETPVAVVQLKIGKTNARTGLCKISGKILGANGTTYTIRSTSVSTGSAPQQANGVVVSRFGTLDLVLGENGFAGTCAASPFGALELRTLALGDGLTSNPATFRMESIETLAGLPVLTDCLPDGTQITVGRTWTFAKATKVKYVREKGTSPTRYNLVLDEGTDGSRTNRSALKLSYTARTSSFKGSFSVYLTAGTEARPRLKKVQVKVTGLVVAGKGVGFAVARGQGTWPITIE